MSLTQIAATTQGSMVGDYISTSVIGSNAFSVFAVGKAPTGGTTATTTHGAGHVTGSPVVKGPLPKRR
jgi:predicted HAD superfamily phosphohydrolase YqeG